MSKHSFGEKLHNFLIYCLWAILLVMLLTLSVTSLVFSATAENMDTQKMLFHLEKPVILIAGLLVLSLVSCLVLYLGKKNQVQKAIFIIGLAVYTIVPLLLVLFSRTAPAADPWTVYEIAKQVAAGDLSSVHPTDSYLSFYPQQIGLVTFEALLIKISMLIHFPIEAYHFIKLFYIALLLVIYIAGYKIISLTAPEARSVFAMLMILNLPLLLYSQFVYGEIPSLAAVSVGLYCLIQFANNRKPVINALGVVVLFSLSVFLRKNSLIFVIALLIVLLLLALKYKNISPVIVFALTLIASLSILPLTQSLYESKAQNKLSEGVTMTSYIAMGMQESLRGPGWYNGFNFNTYLENGLNQDVENEIAKDYIAFRKEEFRANPPMAFDFYFRKFLSQWGDGTYAACQATWAERGGRTPLFDSLYSGQFNDLYEMLCNIYQSFIFLCVLGYVIFALKKRDLDSYKYIGLIAVVGGFLFHMIWEANSRYIFPYAMLLIPYSAIFIARLYNKLYKQ